MLREKFFTFINLLFGVFFIYILFWVFWCIVTEKQYLALIMALPAVAAMIFLSMRAYRVSFHVPYEGIWLGLLAVGFVAMVFLSFSWRVDIYGTWDWGAILRSAATYVLEGEWNNKPYFVRYPNNQCFVCILVVFFRMVRFFCPKADLQTFWGASIVLSCIMVAVTLHLFFLSSRRLWGAKKALAAGIFALLCLPLYMWAMFAYTDTTGMMIMMWMVWLLTGIFQSSSFFERANLLRVGGFCVLSALAYHIKVTLFIVSIAVLITGVFLAAWKEMKKILFVLLSGCVLFLAAHIAITSAVSVLLPVTAEEKDRYEFPLTHWIMMALNYGGYVQEDVDFTEGFESYEEKKEANIREIKKRVEQKGLEGMLRHTFVVKVKRTWTDGTFAGVDYLSRFPIHPDGYIEQFVTYTGKYYPVVRAYTYAYYILVLIGTVFSGISNRKKSKTEQPLFFAKMAFLGLGAFLMIWECNSRYLVAYLPLFILVSMEGWFAFRKWLYSFSISSIHLVSSEKFPE